MEIKTITYQRVKNLGNYESERMEMTAELNASDEIDISIQNLKDYVHSALGLSKPEPKSALPNHDEKPF